MGEMYAINKIKWTLFRGLLVIALAVPAWIALSSFRNHIYSHPPGRLPLTVPYDFRSRPAMYNANHTCAVEWIGVDQQYAATSTSWKIRAREHATIKITMTSNFTIEDCNGTTSYDFHVILEGTAVIAPVSTVKKAQDTFVAITAYDAGIYNVHIELAFECQVPGLQAEHKITRVLEKPLHLHVAAANGAGFPRKQCEDFHWRHGRWLECHNTPLACVRTGWVWVANDCHIPILSPDEIINHAPTWIVFAGSSVERGTFLSTVDYVLGSRAANLTESDFWKCWGWMDLTVGNLRVSYLDFRIWYPHVFTGEATHMIPMYLAQSVLALHGIGGERGTGPDVFHVEMQDWDYTATLPALDFAHMIRSWLGHRWKGRFLISLQKSNVVSSKRYQKPALYDLLEKDTCSRIDYVDETNMAAAAMHDMEGNLKQPTWSAHYHKRCSHGGMHSCSVVCDAASQQILNLAFMHKERPRERLNSDDKTFYQSAFTEMKFCLNCPRDLVPFSIKPWLQNSETMCHSFVPETSGRTL